MNKRALALTALLLAAACLLAGCASDVYGEWVTEEGEVYSFGAYEVSIDGETYEYTAKNGEITILFTTDVFGSESSFTVDGTYEIHGNSMTLKLGQTIEVELTRY